MCCPHDLRTRSPFAAPRWSLTRGIAHDFLQAPESAPDLNCLAERPPARFELKELEAYLQLMESKD